MSSEKIKMIIVAILFLSYFGCGSDSTVKHEKNEASIIQTDTNQKEQVKEKQFLLSESGTVNGVGAGSSIEELVEKGVLVKDELNDGEGSFEIWNVMDDQFGKIGYVHEHPKLDGKVGTIFITTDKVKTKGDLQVGSTWADILKAFPSTQVYGSEIEGRTSAKIDDYNYQLDIRNWQYEVEEDNIKENTKVNLIWISHNLNDAKN